MTTESWKPDKNLPAKKRLELLLKSLPSLKERHLRGLRNNLNNRLKSFKGESLYGTRAKDLQPSHPLYDFLPGECEHVFMAVQKELKARLHQKAYGNQED